MEGLNARQAAFVAAYIKERNLTKAAIAAGYSEGTAASQGNRLLKNAKIRAEIDKNLSNLEQKAQIDVLRVLQELCRIATVDIAGAYDENGNLKPIKDIPEDIRRAISGVEVDELWEFNSNSQQKEQVGFTRKVKFWDKNKALENIGRHFKMFTDKLEVKDTTDRADALAKARRRVSEAPKDK